jgi:hypothetical protein
MATEIDKGGTLTVRELLEALTSSAVDPDAPVLTTTLDLHGWPQRIARVKLHRASGAVLLDATQHAGSPCEDELGPDDDVADLP